MVGMFLLSYRTTVYTYNNNYVTVLHKLVVVVQRLNGPFNTL